MSENLAVKCESLKKTYRSGATTTEALRGIDLEVYAGELLMLVGPSGCGKTTLISIIAGILNSDSGVCSLFGQQLSDMSDYEKTRFRGQNIGFIFQAFNLIPTLTVEDNVAVPQMIFGVPRDKAVESSRVILEKVGLGSKFKSFARELSGGQQQRVAVARALIHHPRLIVCDEPTSALDQETGRKVLEMFRQIALEEKRTLIIVTHDSRIFSFADRIAEMNDGRITDIKG